MSDFDDREFKKRLTTLQKQIMPTLQEKALAVAGMQLLRDAVMVAPTVPLQEGWLRGSGSVHVKGKFKSESPAGKKGKANKGPTGMNNKDTAVVGFNTPYAAYLHEGIRRAGTHRVESWSEASSGSKYLESKMTMFKNQYRRLMADTIKKGKSA